MFSNVRNKMKKGCLAALFIGLIAVVPVEAGAKLQQSNSSSQVNSEKKELPIERTAGDFEESWEGENSEWMREEPDAFTSDYGESKIAKRMTQAEKNHNAAVNDGWGGAITIIAMCIVISALVVLSILFMIFGKVSESILTARKKKAKTKAKHAPSDSNELASGEVIAAISLALADYLGGQHDIEDTHITIRRLQKAYSPWNSKIYNLRPTLEHKRNI